MPIYRKEVNGNIRLETGWGVFEEDSIVTSANLHQFYVSTVQLKKNTVREEHTTKTNEWHLIYVDDLKLRVKTQEELQKET